MVESLALTWYILKVAAGTAGALLLLLSSLVAVALVSDAVARRRRRGKGEGEGRSAVYVGRVWHARFKPTAHRFSYPIFYCLVDLDELDIAFPWYVWPVGSARFPALSRFRSADHLKGRGAASPVIAAGGGDEISSAAAGGAVDAAGDGVGGDEGGRGASGLSGATATATTSSSPRPLSSLADRVRDMVEEATGARPTGRVQLLTHLAYLGYCFNPVSFYYCLDKTEREIETVVAEVSNTPWGEMHCYVLNPKTKGVQVIAKDKSNDNDNNTSKTGTKETSRYRFEKEFHVSPFMSMNHTYDWKFTAPDASPGSGLMAQTTLLESGSGKIFFDAKLVLRRQPCFSAAALCWHMTAYPLYTVWVQALIHYQAFRLWWKQVPFFPHPEGAETAASRLVAVVMTPLFNAQEAWDRRKRRRQSGSTCGSGSDGGHGAAGGGEKTKAA